MFYFNLSILLIFDFFKNVDVTKQEEVDKLMLELDGTDNKSKWRKMLFLMLHNNSIRYISEFLNPWVFYFI